MDVYHDGRLVFGYEVTYQGQNGKPHQVGHHIGGQLTGDVRCDTFRFQPGEYITEVTVSSGDLVDRIEFLTDQGRQFIAGGPGGGPRMASMGLNARVIGFGGGLGGHLHHLKIFYIV